MDVKLSSGRLQCYREGDAVPDKSGHFALCQLSLYAVEAEIVRLSGQPDPLSTLQVLAAWGSVEERVAVHDMPHYALRQQRRIWHCHR